MSESTIGRPPAPPASNTGVQSTSAVGQVTALIDWLSFTDHGGLSIEDLLPTINPGDWVPQQHGMMGYATAHRAGNLAWLTDGQPSMGQHVVASGQGCRELEASGVDNWKSYMEYLDKQNCTVTRLDVAIDDRAGVLDLDKIEKALGARHVVTRWKEWEPRGRYDLRQGVRKGRTIEIGSRSSETFLRIYDKALEQGEAHRGEHWIRVELQTRRGRAQALARRLARAEAIGDLVAAIVYGMLDFKEPGCDSNKSRWATAEWWQAFLGAVRKCRLSTEPAVRTVESIKNWIRRQVAPSLSLVVQADGGALDFLIGAIKDGGDRLRPSQLALLGA